MPLSPKLRKGLLKSSSELNSVEGEDDSSVKGKFEESVYFKVKERCKSSNYNESTINPNNTLITKPTLNKGIAKLNYSFYNQMCIDLAKKLLGKTLVRMLENGTILKGCIVETESYLGKIDKASHSFGNKVTDRNKPMFMKPGTTYVYLTYGMYHMLNVSSEGDGAAVLIRAVQPTQGIDTIRKNREQFNSRNSKKKCTTSNLKDFQLCNGPAKFTMGFGIDFSCNKQDLSNCSHMWIEDSSNEIDDDLIVKCRRIGIDSAGKEWASKLLRFYIYGNKSVSKKDKVGETTLLEKQNVQTGVI